MQQRALPRAADGGKTLREVPLTYLNMRVKNALKVFIGFVPAFATFALTKDWWLLAYFGAFIWFGITGLRNILQSVLGGGGIKRSPLLRWNEYVSWERITDSLLYTGFSVPLLDYVVKTVILDRAFGVTTATSPIVLYSVMAWRTASIFRATMPFEGFQRAPFSGTSSGASSPSPSRSSSTRSSRHSRSGGRSGSGRSSPEMGRRHLQIGLRLRGRSHRGHGGPGHEPADALPRLRGQADPVVRYLRPPGIVASRIGRARNARIPGPTHRGDRRRSPRPGEGDHHQCPRPFLFLDVPAARQGLLCAVSSGTCPRRSAGSWFVPNRSCRGNGRYARCSWTVWSEANSPGHSRSISTDPGNTSTPCKSSCRANCPKSRKGESG